MNVGLHALNEFRAIPLAFLYCNNSCDSKDRIWLRFEFNLHGMQAPKSHKLTTQPRQKIRLIPIIITGLWRNDYIGIKLKAFISVNRIKLFGTQVSTVNHRHKHLILHSIHPSR